MTQRCLPAGIDLGDRTVVLARAKDSVHRQYQWGLLNRRIVASVEGLESHFREITGRSGAIKLLCTCGHDGCDELIAVPIEAYEYVRACPHQFVVAKEHATEANDILIECDTYDVVAIKAEYRDSAPPTAHP